MHFGEAASQFFLFFMGAAPGEGADEPGVMDIMDGQNLPVFHPSFTETWVFSPWVSPEPVAEFLGEVFQRDFPCDEGRGSP